MRTAATTASPNYRDVSDPELLRYGTPDMILVTQGVKLYVHSSKCAAYSEDIREQITHPDPFFGKMLVIKNNRSPKAATALLDTIYSPQKLPGAADLFETCEIAEDYEMDLVLQKIKLGLIKRGSVKILLDALATLKPSSRIPPAVIEAFAEFTLHELSVMPRYEELPVLLRRRIAETRVKILENLLQTQPSMKNVYSENEGIFFRPVPDDEYVEIVKTQEKFTKAKNVIRGVAAFGGRGGSGSRSAVAGRRGSSSGARLSGRTSLSTAQQAGVGDNAASSKGARGEVSSSAVNVSDSDADITGDTLMQSEILNGAKMMGVLGLLTMPRGGRGRTRGATAQNDAAPGAAAVDNG